MRQYKLKCGDGSKDQRIEAEEKYRRGWQMMEVAYKVIKENRIGKFYLVSMARSNFSFKWQHRMLH
ncbi:unnamed protein product [Acanthoscelides obtectus]|uniref:Uncharacterized protein n=1 Tax=Acanthoscelides obtectus TaxID=200917 RepID=A0A9P0PRF2_ACAOB|nr:unnamed protein product [Acanthoscelides obtectus]CAK1630935.1 hypothetical protein AOBTE_LOCUS6654 [Acanthoscelides obtectus]